MSLSYGLNITKKPSIGQRPPPAKRKTIFDDDDDDDSGPEDGGDNDEDQLESISTIGGLQKPASKPHPSTTTTTTTKPPPPPSSSSSPSSHPAPKKPPKISQYGNLSTSYTTNKHARAAQEIDPSIYDYDAAYDSLHAAAGPPLPATNSSSASSPADRKPKYMGNLLAAADVRKRDALRAKEKMLQKEREAEGDEFKDKEAFVTGAYKRQQAEMRALEEEEQGREREAEERRRREGGGMKALYKNLLERDEERHRGVMQAVEEGRGRGDGGDAGDAGKEKKKEEGEKSEGELAREMGAQVNEDGQVVDKRQLLGAGLNAGAAAPKARPAVDHSRGRKSESRRERESRMFEEQLLGKRSASPDDRDSRAAKSRKMEDELLAAMGSP